MKSIDCAILVLAVLSLVMVVAMIELRVKPSSTTTRAPVVAQAPPPPPSMPTPEDGAWIVVVRIQKTGTKSFLAELNQVLDAVGWRRCTGVPWCCTRVDGYSPGNGVRACADVLPAFYAHPPAGCRSSTVVHSDYTDLTRSLTEPFVVVTMIRDPVRRVISEYKHLSGGVNKPKKNWDYVPADKEPKNRENFLAFLEDQANAPGMRNRQTRMLGGWHADEQEMLRRAKKNLAAMPFFGVTELWDESIDMLWRAFGLEHPVGHAHARADAYDGKQVFAMDRELVEEVLQYNTLDEELFQFGKTLFLARLRACKEN